MFHKNSHFFHKCYFCNNNISIRLDSETKYKNISQCLNQVVTVAAVATKNMVKYRSFIMMNAFFSLKLFFPIMRCLPNIYLYKINEMTNRDNKKIVYIHQSCTNNY